MANIDNKTMEEMITFYDETLNVDKSTYVTTNDEPTPMNCVIEMINKIPQELWERPELRILDPCCGNGNFSIPIFYKLKQNKESKEILENIIHFNDINEKRLNNVHNVFLGEQFNLNITNNDFLSTTMDSKYDLIVANPPYAKFLDNGKRASKNHNLIKDFIQTSLKMLKPNGYLLFITPDNWMSYADRNILIEVITQLQIIHLDIHNAKKYFKKIGSSFTWYIIENCPAYKDIVVTGTWQKIQYTSMVKSMKRRYVPLLYNQLTQDILLKTVDLPSLEKFQVKTSSDLHRYTKKQFISNEKTDVFIHKLIHTPKQTVWASKPHKFQDGYKVFISTTDKYKVFVDDCGMTQSIVFIICDNNNQAQQFKMILEHPLYVFINNICRWGNFNNIRILQSFPIPKIIYTGDTKEIYNYFGINENEIKFIENWGPEFAC
jgi:methylase of polypeptide subunit release factors